MSNSSPTIPFRIDPMELARNGQVPDARFITQVSNAQNNINTYRRKEVFREILSATANIGQTMLRGYFHSGHAAVSLCFSYALGAIAHSGNDPQITINLQPAGGGTTLSETIHSIQNNTAVAYLAPSDMSYGRRFFSLSSDTDYIWWITGTDLPHLQCLDVFELGQAVIDGAVNYFVDPSGSYAPIYDATRQRLHQGLSQLWKHNGAHILNWSQAGTTSKTISGTTWTNVIDATTAVASTSAGYAIGNGLLQPYGRRSEIMLNILPKATFAVYVTITGGAGTGEVRLMTDAAVGSPTLISITGINAAGWWVFSSQRLGASNFGPNDFSKADLQFRMSGGVNTLSLEAACLFLYES
jgi:hypothetical protein